MTVGIANVATSLNWLQQWSIQLAEGQGHLNLQSTNLLPLGQLHPAGFVAKLKVCVAQRTYTSVCRYTQIYVISSGRMQIFNHHEVKKAAYAM